MGHKYRSTKSSFNKDVSPMRGYIANKPQESVVVRKTSTQEADSSNKWKWNNMVKENRDTFNNLHFC